VFTESLRSNGSVRHNIKCKQLSGLKFLSCTRRKTVNSDPILSGKLNSDEGSNVSWIIADGGVGCRGTLVDLGTG
jgi:hypothetical protein